MSATELTVLTVKQLSILHFIRAHSDLKGFPPTKQEIADHFNFASLNAVTDHLAALKKKGCIESARGKARSITVTNSGMRAVALLTDRQKWVPA